MSRVADPAELARLLRGTWAIRATTFPYWMSAERKNPRVTFELVQPSPLQLREVYEYHRPDKGDREVEAEAAWAGRHFSWRMHGRSRLLASAYVVSDTPATPDIIAIHFGRSALLRQSAVTILARPALDPDEVRRAVSKDTHSFELSADEFWQLQWLAPYSPPSPASSDSLA
ncbi:hypothetical protein OVA14_11980 [Agrococcus sp. SL85]|uniref:hypothetical protein n=1 Tax=Agrococcus sp. SL85 TaxID=2995141 RepID=UPI00226CA522|nr:hypothetical protein [Agrococcus sp. SL85]WAC65995.1 hypothetical protein OVA14_11980 [Agrococcus sp. SL85]